MLSLDSVQKSSKKTIRICYSYHGCSKYEDARCNLFEMAKYLEMIRPHFTAADFYNINRGTIVSLFSGLTAYFIVILQFNKPY